jgi:hypothetical protein
MQAGIIGLAKHKGSAMISQPTDSTSHLNSWCLTAKICAGLFLPLAPHPGLLPHLHSSSDLPQSQSLTNGH